MKDCVIAVMSLSTRAPRLL